MLKTAIPVEDSDKEASVEKIVKSSFLYFQKILLYRA